MAFPQAEVVTIKASQVGKHGSLGHPGWPDPQCVTEFDSNARYSFTALKAHEFYDPPGSLRTKVAVLADLVRRSKCCMAFTGAGISTAAGIDDYATKGRDQSVTAENRPSVKDWKDARPTKSHRVMAAMHEAGMLQYWVQQNHDSLPQKAGYPQHALNEIHGSLHDPANPIVPYEGNLRNDLFQQMHSWSLKNDLCLALGTSLSGFNVDSIAETSWEKCDAGKSLGLVIVNLQQTPYDDLSALRIFARIDDVMEALAVELAIADQVRSMDHVHVPSIDPVACITEDVFRVPFDKKGDPCEDTMVWDLRIGQYVRLTGGPYDQDIGKIVAKSESGHYRIRFQDSINPDFNIKRRPFSLWLGSWWLEEVTKGFGIVPGGRLPFVNLPEEEWPAEPAPPPPPQPRDPAAKKKPFVPPPPGSKGKGKGKGKSKTGEQAEEERGEAPPEDK